MTDAQRAAFAAEMLAPIDDPACCQQRAALILRVTAVHHALSRRAFAARCL